MKFDTYTPCEALKPFVKSFAISENAAAHTYKVLPDTGLVIGFQYRGKLSYLKYGSETPLASAGITGLRDSYRVFSNSANIGTVLVFFAEGGAAPFFNLPIHELFGESLSLDHFMLASELMVLEEQLCEAKADEGRIRLVERFLLQKMSHADPDPLVVAAVTLINRHKGNIRIRELLTILNTSQSPLEKRFRRVVGTSPKKFANIVRLKHTLQEHYQGQPLTDLGYQSGFYDQAHFIKAFKNFTGESPENFFSGR
ncbi:helix-turn-helix domain-containing protein [Mucilaginibacter sp. AK015]|uniref:helix-turn-helix domain-containing protein n=1 Tax=Mucilaginibacter sp. AK015 TaxID=2723072 RepID=UPI001616A2DF|nr:helix-turn-helix domain-containing protein [Mucilaginibacter sp. AK015]MBB5396106.1 AraC-like DNA-binding protein [Mucilaginibacter sp. AK015]